MAAGPGRGAGLHSGARGAPIGAMLGRSGYRALPLGDFDRFQQSSFGFLGSQKGCVSPERGALGPGAGEWPPSTTDRGRDGGSAAPQNPSPPKERRGAVSPGLEWVVGMPERPRPASELLGTLVPLCFSPSLTALSVWNELSSPRFPDSGSAHRRGTRLPRTLVQNRPPGVLAPAHSPPAPAASALLRSCPKASSGRVARGQASPSADFALEHVPGLLSCPLPSLPELSREKISGF